jgi:hypothetical protein
MDRADQQSGEMDAILQGLRSVYCQSSNSDDIPLEGIQTSSTDEDRGSSSGESSCKEGPGQPGSDLSHPTLKGLPVDRLRTAVRSVAFMIRLQKRGLSV